jgi:hypothetical protein
MIAFSLATPELLSAEIPQSGFTTLTSLILGCFLAELSYHPKGNLEDKSSDQVGASAEGQGFLKALFVSFAWWAGRDGEGLEPAQVLKFFILVMMDLFGCYILVFCRISVRLIEVRL